MIGSLLRQMLSPLEVSFFFLSQGQDAANIQVTSSLMRQYLVSPTYHPDRSDPQPEYSSEREGVMNELPNSTIHPICPREKLLMLSRLGRSSSIPLGRSADDIVVGKVCQLASLGES